MQTEETNTKSRILAWEGSLNTRDLGGVPLRGGRRMRWQKIVRSENLNNLTLKGQQALVDYGIRTVIDLRFHSELERWPNPFSPEQKQGLGEVDFIHNPLDQDQDLVWTEGVDPADAMSDMYIRLLETNQDYIGRALKAMAYARPGGVIFHCHAGKDRTGLVAAMLLGALGASTPTISEDYAFTSPELEERARIELVSDEIPPEKRAYLQVLYTALPETMRRTLTYLKKTYGSLEGYLISTTMTVKDISALRERYTEPLS